MSGLDNKNLILAPVDWNLIDASVIMLTKSTTRVYVSDEIVYLNIQRPLTATNITKIRFYSKYSCSCWKLLAIKVARKEAPILIFIDELDSVGTSRENDEHVGTTQALVQLLFEMTHMDNKTARIVLVCATNLPHKIGMLQSCLNIKQVHCRWQGLWLVEFFSIKVGYENLYLFYDNKLKLLTKFLCLTPNAQHIVWKIS